MLTYVFPAGEGIAKYEYLYRCIKADIVNGVLAAGSRLPSKRAFAKQQQVSVATVENAYAQLLAEGYILSRPRSGFFVCALASGAGSSRGQGVSWPQAAPEVDWWADLVSNRVAPEGFPFATWARLMRSVMAEERERLLTPSGVKGSRLLREAIAAHLRDFRGLSVHPEQVVVGAGTEYLYGLLIQLLGREKVFAVEDPGYPKLGMVLRANGVRFCPVALDESGVAPEALRACGADVVHLSPSHHFPTGIVMPVGRRYALFAWAMEEPGRYMIEDDYDSEFRLVGSPIPPMAALAGGERVIYMNTFTKSLSPTIRISYMVLPPELLRRFEEKLGFYACPVSNFEQYTLARFIQGGFLEKHINRMRNRCRVLRDQLLQAVRGSSLARGGTMQEGAGLHFLLRVETSRGDAELVERAAKRGIRISCLSQYFAEAAPDTHTLLVNYAGLDAGRIGELIRRLEACL